MRTNCGIWRLPQENESSPVAVHPISAPRQSRFSDRTLETQRYRPDHPMQSYLENRPLTISTPHSFPTHNHCKISAYGSSANPTSNHRASSQYVSPWRSVARWETNGADPLPPVVCEKKDSGIDRAAIRLCLHLGCLDEKAVRAMGLSQLLDEELKRASTVRAKEMEQEYGQIAVQKPCPEINADPLPPSNVALFSQNVSHSHDISANPS